VVVINTTEGAASSNNLMVACSEVLITVTESTDRLASLLSWRLKDAEELGFSPNCLH